MRSPEKRCGLCSHFDTKDIQQAEMGLIEVDGRPVKQGFCRTNAGLMFGRLNETMRCKQSDEAFKIIQEETVPIPS